MSKVEMSDIDVLNRYSSIRHRAERALKPLLFNLPHMIPTPDLDWVFPHSPRLSTERYAYSLVSLYVSSETKISMTVNVIFGINDEETVCLTFSDKYFTAWLAANS